MTRERERVTEENGLTKNQSIPNPVRELEI